MNINSILMVSLQLRDVYIYTFFLATLGCIPCSTNRRGLDGQLMGMVSHVCSKLQIERHQKIVETWKSWEDIVYTLW